jgi:Transcriptional regulator containing an amidase domain and an AraC-type DNA-binding HTH domain
MTLSLGILAFDDVEELDFVGPWEVFTMANEVAARTGIAPPFAVRLIAPSLEPVRCAKGLRVLPDAAMEAVDTLDIVLIPGGQGTRREVNNASLLAWIVKIAAKARWVTSVCTGALLLAAAGPARGKRVTTHWAFAETLAGRGEVGEVLVDERYVVDGNLVTAAGVSAGIDMALWLVATLCGADFARTVKRAMQYEPAPPV